jgi:hypothetical protein
VYACMRFVVYEKFQRDFVIETFFFILLFCRL